MSGYFFYIAATKCFRYKQHNPRQRNVSMLVPLAFLLIVSLYAQGVQAESVQPEPESLDGKGTSEKIAPSLAQNQKDCLEAFQRRTSDTDTSPPPSPVSGYKTTNSTQEIPREAQRFCQAWQRILLAHNPTRTFEDGVIQSIPSASFHWKNLVSQYNSWPSEKKLQYVNGFFNRWAQGSDLKIYGQEEYWATPEEFLTNEGGDCEDFAIIKYFALQYLGWSTDDMWIILGRSIQQDSNHAILLVRDGKGLFVLDNLSKPHYLLIPEKQYMQNFIPQWALGVDGFLGFKKEEPENQEPAVTKLSIQ